MTERLGTPIHSRTLCSELLFEGYYAPSVTFGLGGLWSWYGRLGEGGERTRNAVSSSSNTGAKDRTGKNIGKLARSGNVNNVNNVDGVSSAKGVQDGLVIDMGHWSTSIIPVLDGKGVMDRAKR
jgi:actin-related protein